MDLFLQLESNETRTVEEVKQKIYDQFYLVHESWLLYGLYDYYLQTSSARCMEILVNIREPHQNYLFNKLSDSIKGSKHDAKVRALTLLGYVLRKDPPWLYKITEHQLIKDLLKFLKNENDIFLLLCALLVLVVLLPIVPSRMGNFLQDVFEIFSRLAAWNCSNPEKLVEDQMIHMQMALYALFQRLYGMYPCNFLAYLRNQYRTKEHLPIFIHTVKPMLDTVKMNPLLVTASKDKETTTERWKKMGAHDVVVECERFSLDVGDRCHHEACYLTSSFRSRSGTTSSITHDSCQTLQFLKSTSSASLAYEAKDFFSPSMTFSVPSPEQDFSSQDINSTASLSHLHLQGIDQSVVTAVALSSQEGTSPPEAAIEATPETTPVKDIRPTSRGHLSSSSSAVRAISNSALRNLSGGSTSSTPSHSQPSSPMRKESSPFSFFSERTTSAFALPKKDSYPLKKLQQLAQERNRVTESDSLGLSKNFKTPTSPLRIVNSNEIGVNVNNLVQRIESPVSREDEEVLEIVKQGEMEENSIIRQCDSVLQESEGGRGTEDDLDECEQEHGSPCTAGGLHMPNSRSVNDFAKKIRRLRYHSQCTNESEIPFTSTGSSPGNCQIFESDTVRRASSCPEIKKSSAVPTKDNRDKTLLEADEDSNKEGSFNENRQTQKKDVRTIDSQTTNYWPLMPYEHLFLGLFPSMESTEIKPSPIPSPAPTNVQDKFSATSPYEIIDKYIDLAVNSPDKDVVKSLKQQLQLLHQQLLFERHRRQTHAFKNRRLLADAKSSKVLEELNFALRDQVQLQQKDIDSLKEELEKVKKDTEGKRKLGYDNAQIWETKFINLQKEYKMLKHDSEKLQQDLQGMKLKRKEIDNKWQHSEAALIDAQAEVQVAQEEAWAGEKGKVELEQVNKELLISGEIQLRYKEKLLEIPYLKKSEQELTLIQESYSNEIKSLQQQLELKTTYLEASRARVIELEDVVNHNEDSSTSQKRVLSEIKYEYDEKFKSIMTKYKNQIALNRSKDEMMLELWSRIETTTNQRLHSPDISSCHEVQAIVTDKSNISGTVGDAKESAVSTSKT